MTPPDQPSPTELNSRVFDALASGSLVVTNCQKGAYDLFDRDFPVWHDAVSLKSTLDALTSDADLRDQLTLRYRDIVLARHTYAHRALQLREALEAAEHRLSWCIKIGAPDWEQAQRWGDLHFAQAVQRELRRRGHRRRSRCSRSGSHSTVTPTTSFSISKGPRRLPLPRADQHPLVDQPSGVTVCTGVRRIRSRSSSPPPATLHWSPGASPSRSRCSSRRQYPGASLRTPGRT